MMRLRAYRIQEFASRNRRECSPAVCPRSPLGVSFKFATEIGAEAVAEGSLRECFRLTSALPQTDTKFEFSRPDFFPKPQARKCGSVQLSGVPMPTLDRTTTVSLLNEGQKHGVS